MQLRTEPNQLIKRFYHASAYTTTMQSAIWGAPDGGTNTGRVGRTSDFQPISLYVSETVQERDTANKKLYVIY